MNRLTKKFNGEYYRNDANTIVFNNETDYNAIQKLGKLEDVEEELGCPLEVVFRALEEGINVVCFDEEIHFHSSPSLNKYDEFYFSETYYPYGDSCCDATDDSYQVKLSDYQKTWWLKGEK